MTTPTDAPLRVVGVAHLYRLEGHEDPRAVPVMIAAPAPARHHNLFALVEGLKPDESGFILSDGSFADRKRAFDVAVAASQVKVWKTPAPHTLFSEDLW
ncbi:hypothetical protein [Brevundimonas sp. FT23028]|uniref:hypothetical protein n=1 Tax=Brevundimonas sp. FT23028 TaxID=3393748 RepID=UPI003B586F25